MCANGDGDDGKDQRTCGKEQEAGGRGDALVQKPWGDSGSSEDLEKQCVWNFPRSQRAGRPQLMTGFCTRGPEVFWVAEWSLWAESWRMAGSSWQ